MKYDSDEFKRMEEKLSSAVGRSAEHIFKHLPIDKARLLILADFVTEEDFRNASRKDLLSVRGIGPKTVDTIEKVLEFLALPKEEQVPNQWIIRVKMAKGLYRILQIPKGYTFEELADSILWAFDFDNDHAHAFFMDGVAWSDYAYYASYLNERAGLGASDQVTLEELQIGQEFLFLFDFGDDWQFTCKITDERLVLTRDTYLLVAKGESPSQY